MKLTRHIAIGILIVFSSATFVCAQAKPTKYKGAQPYIPSRLEWLAVEMNAGSRVPLSLEDGYSMDFVPLENNNTIVIYVRYMPKVNREIMNMNINGARKVIDIISKARGWSSWLKIKENVEMLESMKQGQ